MKRVKLKDIANITAGQGAPQGEKAYGAIGLPFVKAGHLNNLISGQNECELPKIAKDVASQYRLKQQPAGAIIFAKSGMSCMKGYIHQLREDCYVVSHLAVVIPQEKGLSDYLRHYFTFNRPNALIKDESYPSISLADIGNLEITLYPNDLRAQIVQQLDIITELISIRQQQVQKLDQLTSSRFLEMFGRMPHNEKHWPVVTIRDVITEVRYGSSRPAVENGQYPYLRMNNITYSGELDLSEIKRVDVPDNELSKCSVRRGDVLFNRTNSKELVGKTCVYNRDEMMVLAGFVIRVRLNHTQMLPEFLSTFLNTDFSKKMLLNMCKSAIGQANINAQEMQNISIFLPPLELQKDFVAVKQQLDKSKVIGEKQGIMLEKITCHDIL